MSPRQIVWLERATAAIVFAVFAALMYMVFVFRPF